MQTNARAAERTDAFSHIIRTGLDPIVGAMTGMANASSDFFNGVGRAGTVSQQRRKLGELELSVRLYQDRVDYLQGELSRIRKTMELPEIPGKTKIAGLVVAFAPLENRITINRGTADGVRAQLPVLSGDGLVGIVQTVDAHSSQALLISSPQIRIGAMVNRQPAPYGLIRGESPNKMLLEIIGVKNTVEIGDVVLTSGLGELIPGGIPIGIVSQKEPDEEYGALRCQVFPYVVVGDVREVIILR